MILRGIHRPDLLREETLSDLLSHTAQTQPEQIALIDGDRTISYVELNQLADRVAHYLIINGVKAGNIVGLWLPRGANLLIAQAGIAKAGAAWLPFDADTPSDRIQVCLEDANAVGLFSCAEFLPALCDLNHTVWPIEVFLQQPNEVLRQQHAEASDAAYVIYTSGSTGKPKGIVINQGSICHFLRSENSVLGIHAADRVYQGFSVAFDMSFEEIWMSYLVGASLWLAPKCVVSDPDALVEALEKNEISILHAVPTLLALLPRDVGSLRLINLGGEMCPDAVVERWATPYRQVFNTYGPTETTVSASLAELKRGQAVTIGKPLPNYSLLVMGENQTLLPTGEIGELCIMGPGVAMGYLGRPDLTAEKFLTNPFAESPLEARLYRTGDLAKMDQHGQIHCLGRADDQVKIRGFRVELGEIEAALCEQSSVGTAAVIVKSYAGIDQLIAFVVLECSDSTWDSKLLRQALQARLPSYMVPMQIIQLVEMPRLLSGKIDRKALRLLEITPDNANVEADTPQTTVQKALFAALTQIFPAQAIRFDADFFTDFGGHSLLAARVISLLRTEAAFAGLSVQCIYQGRTIGAIADALEHHIQQHENQTQAVDHPAPKAPPTMRRILCGIAQAACLPALISLRMLQWLAPFFSYHYLTGDEGDSRIFAMGIAVLVYLLSHIISFAVAILGKKCIFGGVKAGRYPLWGYTYFSWWLSERLSEIPAVYLLSGSSLYHYYLRALGAKIGRDVAIGSMKVRVPHLLHIDDYADIGSAVNLENAHLEQDALILGHIHIGKRAFVGSYAVLHYDTTMAEDAYLDGLSALTSGHTIPANQEWNGSPAQKIGTRPSHRQAPRPHLSKTRAYLENLYYLAGVCIVAALFFMPVFPSFMLIDWIDGHWLDLTANNAFSIHAGIIYFLLGIPASALLIIATILVSVLLRWMVLPSRMQAGVHPIHGQLYYRKWLTNQIQETSLQVLHGLYATVYAPLWYRLLGARVGRDAEISTAMGVVPDMLTLGDDSFIADAVMLGDEHIENGWMTLRPTYIGNRSFVGNGAYIPDGSILPDEVLIGVQSKCPENKRLQAGQTWVGNPPMHLPAREKLTGFSDALTFRPSMARRLGRGTVEALRIVLPMAMVIAAGYLTVLAVLPHAIAEEWWTAAYVLSLCGLIYGIASFALVVILKWLLIGKYTPRSAPMWSPFVWLSEAVTNIYESIAVPNFVNALRGTPFLPWALRIMGCTIGKGVLLDSTDITEYDCVKIGNYSVLNANCGPQTHLFEDRIMKIGKVEIGAYVTISARSTILYDSRLDDGVLLGPLSLILKGECLPAHTAWAGSPAQTWSPQKSKV